MQIEVIMNIEKGGTPQTTKGNQPRSTNITYEIDPAKVLLLRTLLESAGYSFASAPHAFWTASDGHTTITFYKSGKLLLQGEATEAAANLLTDAGIAQQARDPAFPTWIGTDESGKGDYFGPLTIAGVLVTRENHRELLRLGVKDSKRLSDTAIKTLAPQIRNLCPHSVATITPREYNGLYLRMRNLNRLLAWGHARVIEVILSNHSSGHAITDQFGDETYLKAALMEKGRQITLLQKPHAEDDPAVASASILARDAFLNGIESLSSKYHIDLPKGASTGIIETGQAFVARHGKAKLEDVAKAHFVTTQRILDPKSEPSFFTFNEDEFMDLVVKKRP